MEGQGGRGKQDGRREKERILSRPVRKDTLGGKSTRVRPAIE